MFLESIRKEIDRAEVVSFDIFDTLLLRPYLHPTDLFRHLERIHNKPLYAKRRVEAEWEARSRHCRREDITLDMVYAELDAEYRDMQQIELEWEATTLRANPEMEEVYAYARAQGKHIIIASDMYLPTDFLANTLRRCGYEGWEKLYVSGELGESKNHGTLFRTIKQDTGGGYILHIGDNTHSDVKMPRKYGIHARAYTAPGRQFLKAHPRYLPLTRGSSISLGLSILIGVYTWEWMMQRVGKRAEQTYWQAMGYRYAGPIGYGYARYAGAEARAHQVNELLFVARDGYLLQKIYNTFAEPLPSAYIYAPRFLNNTCRLDVHRHHGQQLRSIIAFFTAQDTELAAAEQSFTGSAYEFLRTHQERFTSLAQKQMSAYAAYVSSRTSTRGKYAAVDTLTSAYSAQKMLENATGQAMHGIYWGVCWGAMPRQNCSYYAGVSSTATPGEAEKSTLPINWDFVEFLLSSPEHPIVSVDAQGAPVFAPTQSEHELRRAALYPAIEEGALAFVRDVNAWFCGQDIYLSAAALVSWADAYLAHPTRQDMTRLRGLCCARDSAHKEWKPLLMADVKPGQFLRAPYATLLTLIGAQWRSRWQTLLLCVCVPCAARAERRARRLTFSLFPCLRKCYFSMSFHTVGHLLCRFVVGSMKG